MSHRTILELSSQISVRHDFTAGEELMMSSEPIAELEVSNTDEDLTLVIGDVLSVTLSPREAVLLASIILERTYRQL